MIEVRNLTKRFGPTVAVDDLSFDVSPGMVTGFLGPTAPARAPRSAPSSASTGPVRDIYG